MLSLHLNIYSVQNKDKNNNNSKKNTLSYVLPAGLFSSYNVCANKVIPQALKIVSQTMGTQTI